jgi:hypothetical protein
MRWRQLSVAAAFLLSACQDSTHGTEERLRAAAEILGAEYKINPDWYNISFEMREANTWIAVAKRGGPRRFELQEPEHCKFRFTVEANTPDATNTAADLSKLKRIEALPTTSGLLRVVFLAGDEAEAVSVQSRYGLQKSNQVQLNNLEMAKVPTFLARVADFQDKMCGIKIAQ